MKLFAIISNLSSVVSNLNAQVETSDTGLTVTCPQRSFSRKRVGCALRAAIVCLLALVGWAPVALAGPLPVTFNGSTSLVGSGYSAPYGTAVDRNGNVFVADRLGGVVYEVPASCIAGANNINCMQTIGGGFFNPQGIAIDSGGNVYVSDAGTDQVYEVPAMCIAGSNDSSCTVTLGAGFSQPFGIAVDTAGDVFVGDVGNHMLKEIPASCIAGANDASCIAQLGGATSFTKPYGVAVDSNGTVYVANFTTGLVKDIPLSCYNGGANDDSCIGTIGGGFSTPVGVAVDANQNVFVTDSNSISVYGVSASCIAGRNDSTCTRKIDTYVFHTGTVDEPVGISIDQYSNLYVAAPAAATVIKVGIAGGSLGGVKVGSSAPKSINMNFLFNGGVTLGSTPYAVLTQGQQNLDFFDGVETSCVAGSYSAGQSCYVTVKFTPTMPGLRTGAVVLLDNSGNVLATGYLQGKGIAPLISLTPGIIQAEAGKYNGGVSGYSGDTGLATNALLHSPDSVAVDAAGNVYITDLANNVIRKVAAGTNIIITVAGNGTAGYGGDGGPATSAELKDPEGIAVDGAGNIYIADTLNNAVRKVSADTHVITTVAGMPNQDGGYSGDGGPATSATLHEPTGIALDGYGNIYFADAYNNVIRMVTAWNGQINTVAGNYNGGNSGYSGDGVPATSALLYFPIGIALDTAGNLYIADTYNQVVRAVSASTGLISTVAGDYYAGPGYSGDGSTATGAQLSFPSGIAVDAAGNLYINDSNNNAVRMVTPGNGLITTIAGGGTNCYTASDNTATDQLGDGCLATQTLINYPGGVALDGAGNLFIADMLDNMVRKVPVNTSALQFVNQVPMGQSDDSQPTIYVNNIGTDDLIFAATGLKAPIDFVQALNTSALPDCANSATVTSGLTCILNIAFQPLNEGDFFETFTLTDNTMYVANAQQTVALEGVGSAPACDDCSCDDDCGGGGGDGGGGGPVTLTIENIPGSIPDGMASWSYAGTSFQADGGTAPYTYTMSPSTLDGGLTLSVDGVLTGTPAASGSYNFTVMASDGNSDSGSQDFSLTVLDKTVPVGSGAPPTIAFAVTVQNGGTLGALSVVTQGITGLDFTDAVTGDTCAINSGYNPGDTCTVNVTFNPLAPGQRFGAIVLLDLSGNVMATNYISGVGLAPLAALTPGIISTTLGNGTLATLNFPTAVVVDVKGNQFIADYNNQIIRRLDATTNTLSIVAGGGTVCADASDALGDGCPATSAQLANPSGLALDGAGNLYITQYPNSAIRKVDANTHIISIVAGGGTLCADATDLLGDGCPATQSALFDSWDSVAVDSAGNIYIPDFNGQVVHMVSASTGLMTVVAGTPGSSGYSGDYGPATSAQLNGIYGVAVDSAGNLYIADSGNNVIREVLASTNNIITIVGDGTPNYSGDGGDALIAELNMPTSVAVDPAGNLYIADYFNHVIRFVNQSTGYISTIAGNGVVNQPGDGVAATAASLLGPYVVALDGSGNLYIDDQNGAIRKVNVGTSYLSFPTPTIAGYIDMFDGLQKVIVNNIGNADLAFDENGIQWAPDFIILPDGNDCANSGTVAVGSTCFLFNGFVPMQIGNPLSETVTLTDNSNNSATAPADQQTITLIGIATPPPPTILITVTPATLPAGTVGTAYAGAAFSASGGTSPYTYTMSPANLAGGLTLSSDGALSGTPTGIGSFTFTVTATDSNTFTGSQIFTLYVRDGSVTVGTPTPQTNAVTVTLPNGGTIGSISVVTQGVTGLDFTDAVTGDTCAVSNYYNPGDSCSVNVTFNPRAPGLRYGAVVLLDTSGNVLATDYLQGTGIAPLASLTPGVINTVVGDGLPCGSATDAYGDGCIATDASLNYPYVDVVDAAGNQYIADAGNLLIRKVAADTNIITTIAGGGEGCAEQTDDMGNGCQGTDANFNRPSGLAIDGAGNLYITDTGTFTIRKLDANTHVISVFAGNGTGCPEQTDVFSDGCTATQAQLGNLQGSVAIDGSGNIYIPETDASIIQKISATTNMLSLVAGTVNTNGYSGDGGPATSALLMNPSSINLDAAGNLYIADTGNNVIRKVDATTGYISTVAGNYVLGSGYSGDGSTATSAQLNTPTGVTVDPAGNLYIADFSNSVIRMVNNATGKITTVAGDGISGYSGDGGPSTMAWLLRPYSVALDGMGNLYVTDSYGNAVRKVAVSTGAVWYQSSTTVGDIDFTDGFQKVTLNNIGNAALVFTENGVTSVTDFMSDIIPNIFAGGGTLAAGASCDFLYEFVPTQAGNPLSEIVTLTNNSNNATSTPGDQQTITLVGYADAPPPPNIYIAVTPALLPTATAGTAYAGATFSASGGTSPYTYTMSPATLAGGLTLSTDGTLSGTPTLIGNYNFTITATDSNNFTGSQLYTLFVQDSSVIVGTPTPPTYPVTITLPNGGTIAAVFVVTQGITGLDFVDAVLGDTCAEGNTYNPGDSCSVNVTFNPLAPGLRYGAVLLYDSDGNPLATDYLQGTGIAPLASLAPGVINTVAGNGTTGYLGDNGLATDAELNFPFGAVAIDAVGNIFIADHLNCAVRKVSADTGIITTVAGNGMCGGYTGEGGPATDAQLGSLMSIGLDGAGNLYVADEINCAIFKISQKTQTISTYAGNGTCGINGEGYLATDSELANPSSIAIDGSGNLYYSEPLANLVRVIFAASGILQTVAGDASSAYSGDGGPAIDAEMSFPYGLAVDGLGNLYIADAGNNVIRRVDAASGIINTVAGQYEDYGSEGDGGPALLAGIGLPVSVVLDAAGNLYMTDYLNNVVRTVTASTGNISTVAGNNTFGYIGDDGPATSAEFANPTGLAIDSSGNLYITDMLNSVIRMITVDFTVANFPTLTKSGKKDTTDGPSIITINNIGNADLTFTATGLTAPADFVQVAGSGTPADCANSGKVSSGAACNLSIEFEPVNGGPLYELFFLTDNNNNSTTSPTDQQVIVLTGTSQSKTQATLSVNVTSPATYNTQQTLTTSGGSGTGSVSYSVGSSTACSVSGATLTITSGTGTCTVTATKDADSDYDSATSDPVDVTVQPAATSVTWATPSAITYGTPLSATQLNANPSVVGLCVYTPDAGTVLTAGTQTLSVTCTPTDSNDYAPATQTVNLTVNKAVPIINWSAPAALFYGMPLTSTQLDASFSVLGNCVYTPIAGTVLSQGTHTLSVTCTPNDTTDYATPAATNVSINIYATAPLTITATAYATAIYNTPIPNSSFTYTISGFAGSTTQSSACTGYPVLSTPAVQGSPVGIYTVNINLQGINCPGYLFKTIHTGELHITPATLQIQPIAVTAAYGSMVPTYHYICSFQDVTLGTDSCGNDGFAATGKPTLTSSATSRAASTGAVYYTANIGTYTMYSTWGSLKSVSGNYTFAFSTNSMTITPSAQSLAVQPNNLTVKQSACLASGIPGFTFKMSGFMNWDTQASTTTGAPSLTVPSYTGGCAKGNYSIVSAPGTLQLNNYGGQTDYSGINFATATLTIQ